MARILYGGIATEIRGSIAGSTFQGNKYGYTVKSKPLMVKPYTRYQNKIKGFIKSATQAWRQMIDGGRADWNNFAATYPTYSKHNPLVAISGFNMFVAWHIQHFLQNDYAGDIQSEVFLALPANSIPSFELASPSSGELILNVSWDLPNEDWNCNISLTRKIPPGQTFIGSRPRFVQSINNLDSSWDIAENYLSVFGRLPNPGDRIALEYTQFQVGGGRVQAPQQLILVVVS